jgi:hypothetical protein
MTTAISLDSLGGNLPAPTVLRPQTVIKVQWSSIAKAMDDPSWTPTWSMIPVWVIDPDEVFDTLTEHEGSDMLTTAQLADLAARVSRRNAVESHRLVSRMQVGGLDQLVEAWSLVLERWESAASEASVDLTAGPVAVAIAHYLTVSIRLGLTLPQAAAFAACPNAELRDAVARPGAVTRARVALTAHPRFSYAEVARVAEISESYCRTIVARYGDPCREARMTDDRPARVRALAGEGMSYRAIAKEVGCSLGYISKVMK